MFNFFKKPPNEPIAEENNIIANDDENVLASITYLVKKDNVIMVDISINDYDDESMVGLLKILDKLSEDKCYVETVNIIKESLLRDEQDELALLLVGHMAKQITNNQSQKFVNTYQETLNSQPCIKPSDMLK